MIIKIIKIKIEIADDHNHTGIWEEHYNKFASSTKIKPSLRCLTDVVMERFSSKKYCSVYCVTLFEITVCGNVCWCTLEIDSQEISHPF
jgi:hypothetical protein